MALYAYRDSERKDEITAKEAAKENITTRYYCPNPKCDAHLYVCSIEGNRTVHLKATKKDYRHVPGCLFGNSGGAYSDPFDESSFNFKEMISGLIISVAHQTDNKEPGEHGTGEPKARPPRTIRQVYDICKERAPKDMYGSEYVGKMLLCDQSAYFWPKGIYGPLIIEGKCRKFFYKESEEVREIYLDTPIHNSKYNLVLKFGSKKLFKTILSRLFKNRDKIIVVGGLWGAYGVYGTFCIDLKSARQIKILNEAF